jgi:hypothetical protein
LLRAVVSEDDTQESKHIKEGTVPVEGVAYANIFLWSANDNIVISDIDGTITQSNAGGIYDTILTERYTHCHKAVCQFFSHLATSTTTTTTTDSVPSPLLLGNAYTACNKLYEERAKRITALRSLFPPLHFVIVSALAVSICIAFLLETKQDILVFLNAIQLRILWTMLVGTFTALAIVCYDLGHPFRGSYQISKSVQQLYTIRMTLRASLRSLPTTMSTVVNDDDCVAPVVVLVAKDSIPQEEEETRTAIHGAVVSNNRNPQ